MRFREELEEGFGSVLEQLVGQINFNFTNPSAPVQIGAVGLDDLPEPFAGEFQQLAAGLNRGFFNIAHSQLAAPVTLRLREQLPEPLGSELDGIVGTANLGLRNLFP